MSDDNENDDCIHHSFFAVIPAFVRRCKDLEPAAKILYGDISALCNEKGYCFATNAYLAKINYVDERTVQRWLESLKKNNFINVEVTKKGFQTKRRIYLNYDAIQAERKRKNAPQPGLGDTSGMTPSTRQEHHARHEGNVVHINTLNTTPIDDVLTPPEAELQKEESSKDYPGQSGADMYTINMIDGSQIQISGGDVYTAAVMKKKDWTQEEIRVALHKVKTSDALIRDWVSYIDGIIKNNRKQERAKPKKPKRESKPVEKEIEKENPRPVIERDPNPGLTQANRYNERLRASPHTQMKLLAEKNDAFISDDKSLIVYGKGENKIFPPERIRFNSIFPSQWDKIHATLDEILATTTKKESENEGS